MFRSLSTDDVIMTRFSLGSWVHAGLLVSAARAELAGSDQPARSGWPFAENRRYYDLINAANQPASLYFEGPGRRACR
jgi:hypothetical protein